MKIGILTVYDSANFGSFLQAYALNKVLSDMGHDVYFIKIVTGIRRFRDFIKKPKSANELLFNYRNYKKFSKEIKVLKEIELKDVNKYSLDLMIIGSDELWNVKNPFFTQKCFYGINIPVKRKIAYAISIGNSNVEEFKKYKYAIDGIKNLDKVFIRDENTQNTLEEVVGYKCDFACDPTFLIDVDNFKKKYENPINGKYLLVYSYGFNEIEKEHIKRFASHRNLKIVSSGLYNLWSDINVSCSPLEFSSLIHDAEYVITTTFHGTIFSILNKKSFMVFQGSSKVRDVLNRTGMKERLLSSDADFEEFKRKIDSDINFDKAHKNILNMRERSLEALKNEIIGQVERRMA